MRCYVPIALYLVAALATANPVAARELHGSGQSVVDGDEFMLCEGNGNPCVDIRLCGIDTPSKGQPSYDDTIATLSRLVVNQEVVCRPVNEGAVCDGLTSPTSRGRTVAQCFVQQGTVDVAAFLVSAGLGCDRVDRSGGVYSKDHLEWQCQR
jgi:micrococcal nuclease